MKSLFGIQFGKRDETEDQYVARVRKNDRIVRRFKPFWLLIFICHAGLLVAIVSLFDLATETEAESPWRHWLGFGLGLIFGLWFALILAQAVISVKHYLDAKHGFRTERLLIKYYDQTKGK